MLTYLRIKNLALVDDITFEPGVGCNVITGETGAGKSVLMGALGLALGFRGDKGMIRNGASEAVVEAVFDITHVSAPVETFLAEKGVEPCEEGLLRVKRSLGISGGNRQFVNGTPVSVSLLAALGDWLVDIHGPHDHQSLLYPARQLEILDSFGKTHSDYLETLSAYAQSFKKLHALEGERRELLIDEQSYRQQLDILSYQVKEIESASLDEEEDTLADERYRRASCSADILRSIQAAVGILFEEDNSIVTQSGVVGRLLAEVSQMDSEGMAPIIEEFERFNDQLREVQLMVRDYADRVEVDPGELQQLEERLNLVNSLKRKYGKTVGEIISFGKDARQRLGQLENRDRELSELEGSIEAEKFSLHKAGLALSAKRKALIPGLEERVTAHLQELGFKQSFFKIEMTPLDEGLSTGMERVEFLFAPNPGEPAKPLRAIASSGEIARVMLALKTALAEVDCVPVLVFDEVDANVGGETALAVGRKMREIGLKRQVFCITHLAPVAASGNTHFCVVKTAQAQKTQVSVNQLANDERVIELARMLGGQMETAKQYAQTLLEKCDSLPKSKI